MNALKSLLEDPKEKIVEKEEINSKTVHTLLKKKMRFTIPSKTNTSKIRKPQQKILRITSMKKAGNDFEISLKNKSTFTLQNVLIRIYESRGFFSKDKKIDKIAEWLPGESISVKFTPKEDPGILYLLKISDDEGIVKVKRIEERFDLN